jgi:KDO2-lipid IV(A) lauroyltransferase
MGTNQLALLTQYPALYYRIRKVKRGYYEAFPSVAGEPPYDKESTVVIENYVRLVEQWIIENPSGWLWSHNRWKKRHLKKVEEKANKD